MSIPPGKRIHDQTLTVIRCGQICFQGRKMNLGLVFADRMCASGRSASASGS